MASQVLGLVQRALELRVVQTGVVEQGAAGGWVGWIGDLRFQVGGPPGPPTWGGVAPVVCGWAR